MNKQLRVIHVIPDTFILYEEDGLFELLTIYYLHVKIIIIKLLV